MKSISSFSTIIIFTLFTLVGLAILPLLNLQLNPSRTLSSITVSFSWPENEARVVEQEVTSKLEAAFARIAGIKDISSTSKFGAGTIRLSLHKGTNIDAVRFEMSMLVRQVWQALPKGVSYPSIQADKPNDDREPPMLSYFSNLILFGIIIN